MGHRPSDRAYHPLVLAIVLCAAASPMPARTLAAPGQEAAAPGAQSPAERLDTLRKEADALASQQRTLLGELRKIEVKRQLSLQQLSKIERERADARQRLDAAEARAAELARTAETDLPDVEARLVHLYKLGRGGYWRLLLGVGELQALGRAYRLAGSLTAIDRARVNEYYATVDALAAERNTLQERADELETLQAEAVRARSALDRAIASRTALVNSIDARRDLNVQLTGELQAAQEKLQASLAGLQRGRPASSLRAVRGELPWPLQGPVVRPFGRQPPGPAGEAIVRNGMEIGSPVGRAVRSVLSGSVAYADSFSGYGNLVIVDHGGGIYSLYGYLASMEVSRGDSVPAGARVGTSGASPSGNPALYFELRVDGEAVDPVQWLSGSP